MKANVDADRAIERLHGFILYGWKLSVQVARNRYVRKGNQEDRQQTNMAEPPRKGIDDQQKDYKVEARIEKKIPAEFDFERENIKRVTGHVENEELWKLRRCLVGEMETVCSVSSIHNRLIKWGLGDINVQRLGAKLYLLTFMDEELFFMIEDVNWSYLKEIFSEVKPWSEKVSYNERATWLEVRGLPLHCWNGESLKKIAEIWGKVEALGVNANHTHDCEKATILITTRHVRRIEEMVELEVRENVFPVYVRELGFTDGTTYPMCNNRNGVKGNVENLEESKSNSNVNLGEKIQAAEEGDRRNSGTKGEAHEALSAEKEFINGCFRENVLLRVLINESELVGGDPKGVSAVVDKKALKMNELIGGEGFESQQIEDDRSTLQKEV
ncbi:hypothetical protein V6N13_106338 [Hibiscus sabdariffa]